MNSGELAGRPQRWRDISAELLAVALLIAVLSGEVELLVFASRQLIPSFSAWMAGRAWWQHLGIGIVAGPLVTVPVWLLRPRRSQRSSPRIAGGLSLWWSVTVGLFLFVQFAPPRHGNGQHEAVYRTDTGAFWWSSFLLFSLATWVLFRRPVRAVADSARTPFG